VLIYICDYDKDGTPILAVALNVNEIPEDVAETKVGNYALNHVSHLQGVARTQMNAQHEVDAIMA